MARLNTSLSPKLTDSVISVLQSKKIYTVFEFASEDSEKLMQYSGLTYEEILGLKQKITKLYVGGIRRGSELLKISNNNLIRTEIGSLDNLMKGGLQGGQIYEICGLSSSGKSQICHTIAVNVAQKLEGIVHYVDTKGDFSAKRAQTMLKSRNLNEEEQCLILNRIMVTRIERREELMSFLHNLLKDQLRIKKIRSEIINSRSVKLVVIDSLPTIFFNCELDSHYMDQQSTLNHFSNVLRCLAEECNLVVITTNLLTQWRENATLIDPRKSPLVRTPTLGKYWASIPNTRLLLETTTFEKRIITIWKSSCLPSGANCIVEVTQAGVV